MARHNPDSPDEQRNDDLRRHELDSCSIPAIPEELEYLVEPGIRYGRRYSRDENVQSFLENGTDSDFETLAALAERVRLCGDYRRFSEWWYEVHEIQERTLDERFPYMVQIPPERRQQLLRLINEAGDRPEIAERLRERRLQSLIEAEDYSDLAKRRAQVRARLLGEANDKVHHMDIHFLFYLMGACDMEFEN